MGTHDISDETLNAFVDDQLSPEEKEQVYAAMAKDPSISRRLCEIRNIHDLTRMAYLHAPACPSTLASPGRRSSMTPRPWVVALAASMLLGVGVIIGLNLSPAQPDFVQTAMTPGGLARPVSLNPAGQPGAKVTRILFHLNSRDPEMAREALNEVENLLEHYRKIGQKAQIELITNGGGIDLLRIETSPFPKRIHAMQAKYKNLTFVTCQNTINRLKRERGITARLLPGVIVIDSGVAQIMRRQQQGWAYIQV